MSYLHIRLHSNRMHAKVQKRNFKAHCNIKIQSITETKICILILNSIYGNYTYVYGGKVVTS